VKELLNGSRPADLWPEDMPRLEAQPAVATPPAEPVPALSTADPEPMAMPAAAMPAAAGPVAAPAVIHPEPAMVEEPLRVEPIDFPVPALAVIPVIERVELPVSAAVVAMVSDPDDLPAPLPQSTLPPPPAPSQEDRSPQAKVSLSNVFSAMLSAERQNPDALKSMAASPALSERAVEEIVQNVLRKMTNEHVRKIVLETAERLIREEIARIKL
jgi:hypothetical protein